jgi:XTP/dITP diphosphohydrolase
MQLIFATQNQNKLKEIQNLLPENMKLISLSDLNYTEELPETHETLHENALEKAGFVYNMYHQNCFAEDTGLEVKSLNNQPGVYSARYAGEEKKSEKNIELLLKNMNSVHDRAAQFRTVIALIFNGNEFLFEGIVSGKIALHPSGNNGFGYDPVFIPDGYTDTFAQLSFSDKNKISHRAIAFHKLCDFLKNQ